MRRILYGSIVTLCVVLVTGTLAQQQGSTQSPQNTTLKPTMTLGDVIFAINVLNTVEIKGNEVEAFLEVKNTLMKAIEKAQKEKKTETDQVTIEMSLLTANNFLTLFQRASIPGSAAERYKSVTQALFASASSQQSPQEQNR